MLDEDANGVIDRQELKNCFRELKINFTEEEVNDLFEACDISDEMGMKFSEFIVLLCLVYLLKQDPTGLHVVSKIPTTLFLDGFTCDVLTVVRVVA